MLDPIGLYIIARKNAKKWAPWESIWGTIPTIPKDPKYGLFGIL
jgi:hypothetical protein